MKSFWFVPALLMVAVAYPAAMVCGQDPTVLPAAPVFTLDAKTYETKGTIPYDKPFILLLTGLEATIKEIDAEIHEGLQTGKGNLVGQPISTTISNPSSMSIPIMELLKANGQYNFRIDCKNAAGATVQHIDYGFTLKTKLGDYIKLDLGLGYAPIIKGVISQTAVHFYLLPINNDTDLRTIKGLGRNIFLRASVFVGISPVMLYSDTRQPIANSSSIGNILFGFAIRSPFYGKHMPFGRNTGWVFLQPMRLNIGEMYFKQDDANPLVVKNRSKQCFYIGISYDLNIAGLLGPVGKLVKP